MQTSCTGVVKLHLMSFREEADLNTEMRKLPLLHSMQTSCGDHSTSYTTGTKGSLPGVKQPGHDADHSSPASAKVKTGEATLPLPHSSSWHGA
jgi:hypothetical protein